MESIHYKRRVGTADMKWTHERDTYWLVRAVPEVYSRNHSQQKTIRNKRRCHMNHGFTRRRFLVTASATASTVLGSSLFNLETVFAAPYIRRNLGGMSASDPVLVSYRKAIKAMKMLPSSNPLSWAYQAAIHGAPGPALHTAWDTCEH